MAISSATCPVCGAKIPNIMSAQNFICRFCRFERRPATSIRHNSIPATDDISLPFQENLNDYFSEKFQQLEPGGLWHLSTPVKRPFQNAPPLPGQINFFRAKNIMFLLEQHGFKMVWRQNRFSSTLRITARKC